MSIKRNAPAGVLALLIGMQLCLPASAVRVGVHVDSQDNGSETMPGFIVIGHIPASSDLLAVLAESASVKITRSSKVTDIVVATNHPRDWNISGSTIRQAAMLNSHGVAMLSDKLGSRCIANGKIYPMPPGPIQGGISLNKDGVMVGGKKLEPLAGTDIPGIGTGSQEPLEAQGKSGRLKGRVTLPDTVGAGVAGDDGAAKDRLEVTVPQSFAGNLKIGAASNSDIELTSWNGGSLEAYMIGKGTLTAGQLDSLSKAVLDVSGDGAADVKSLTARTLVANVSGLGKISVAQGSADVSNATISGDGSITLKGNYKNLKQAVQGQGTISVSN
jgi:hypothetical protein